MPESVLARIVRAVAGRLAATPAAAELERLAHAAVARRRQEGLRPFAAALRARSGAAVIAECKHASPSAGILRAPFDPVALAVAYQHAGAAAVSVVTEPDFFAGDPAWIAEVRAAVALPVLRKDFVVVPRQLYETAVLGADAVLLIQRLLPPDRLCELVALARELDLEVLLELFADEDPAPAVASGVEVIGINARDLATLAVDLDRVAALAGTIPRDRVRVAESGVAGAADRVRLAAAGFDAFLVGEHLVRAADPAAALRRLLA